jgi:hypothetical protein
VLPVLAPISGAASGLVGAIFRLTLEDADRSSQPRDQILAQRKAEPTIAEIHQGGVLIELRLRGELCGGELLGAVVGLLRQGEVGRGAVDFGSALGDDLGPRADIDARQLRIGDQLFRLGLVQLRDELRFVDHQ